MPKAKVTCNKHYGFFVLRRGHIKLFVAWETLCPFVIRSTHKCTSDLVKGLSDKDAAQQSGVPVIYCGQTHGLPFEVTEPCSGWFVDIDLLLEPSRQFMNAGLSLLMHFNRPSEICSQPAAGRILDQLLAAATGFGLNEDLSDPMHIRATNVLDKIKSVGVGSIFTSMRVSQQLEINVAFGADLSTLKVQIHGFRNQLIAQASHMQEDRAATAVIRQELEALSEINERFRLECRQEWITAMADLRNSVSDDLDAERQARLDSEQREAQARFDFEQRVTRSMAGCAAEVQKLKDHHRQLHAEASPKAARIINTAARRRLSRGSQVLTSLEERINQVGLGAHCLAYATRPGTASQP